MKRKTLVRLLIIASVVLLLSLWSLAWQNVSWLYTIPWGLIIGTIIATIIVEPKR